MAVGAFDDWAQIRLFLTDHRDYAPDPGAAAVYDRAYAVYRDLYPALQGACDSMSALYEPK
jgi:xylulokinase